MAMASESKRATKRLTAAFCENVKEAGRYEDGNGLGLVVSANGARRWLQRIIIQGKRRDLGLGSFDLVPLAEARAKAVANRKLARAGGDPLAEKREKAATPTFAEATGLFLAGKEAGFRNPKHRQQWRNTLDTYAFPKIGHLRVNEITVQDVLRVLAPIWTEKNETASRVRGRIEAILAWATTHGHRMGDNPARWKGGLETILPQPGKVQITLPTGGSIKAAVVALQRWGVKDIRVLSVIAARPGIEQFHQEYPDVKVFVACIDPELNSHKFIVPGLGDAGDRMFNTVR
jgi:hypothetical protein